MEQVLLHGVQHHTPLFVTVVQYGQSSTECVVEKEDVEEGEVFAGFG